MSKMAQMLVALSNASDDDELYKEVERLSDPDNFDDKVDLGKCWEDLIGYNPIEYHDKVFLNEAYDKLVEALPDDNGFRISLVEHKEEVIDKTLHTINEFNDQLLLSALLKVLSEEFDHEFEMRVKNETQLIELITDKINHYELEDDEIIDEEEDYLDEEEIFDEIDDFED